MNREIKFRGKSKEPGCEGKWVTGYFFKDKKDGYMILGGEPQYGWFNHRIEEETLGEYTGLKDKEGKEIWEEDIVEVPEGYGGDNLYNSFIGIIEYEEGEFYVNQNYNRTKTGKWCGQDYSFSDIKKIGNIHDNPELLKQREG